MTTVTGRQADFLRKFLELYREAGKALHYPQVAERLGVSAITAYDMLRLLESRGLVSSCYVLPEGGGAGRSSVVFTPTEQAATVLSQLAGDDREGEEWENTRARILRGLRHGKGTGYDDLLDDLLVRLPGRQAPLVHATEMIAAMLLSLHQATAERTSAVAADLRAIGLPNQWGLEALAGLTLGLGLVERVNQRITAVLLSETARYQEQLATLNARNRKRLSVFTQEVLRIIEA